MKKKAKTILSITMTLILMLSLYINTYALYLESTAHKAPNGTAGQWVSDDHVWNTNTASSPAKAEDIYFYYKESTLKSLPSGFVSSNNRAFKLYVMEDDVSDDEYVKYYTGTFTGPYLSRITFDHIVASSSIEINSGVELYIKQFVGTIAGDTSTSYTSLYSYYFGVE